MKAFITSAILFGISLFLFNLAGTFINFDHIVVTSLIIFIIFACGIMVLITPSHGFFFVAVIFGIFALIFLVIINAYTGFKFLDFNTLMVVSSYVIMGCSISILNGYFTFNIKYADIMNDGYYVREYKRRYNVKSFNSEEYHNYMMQVENTCHPKDSFPSIFCWPFLIAKYIALIIYRCYKSIRSINVSGVQNTYRKILRSLYQ